MRTGALSGHRILVTRAVEQAADLANAVEAAGGTALRLPLLEIVPRDAQQISDDVGRMNSADIVIYVSPNAVRHGFAWHPEAAETAAIGPTTRKELELRGVAHVVCPDNGYDSESLLDNEAFTDVAGKTIRIIRGQDGRELLGSTLRNRGATVQYLAAYLRRARRVPEYEIREFAHRLRRGEISCITVMSDATVESLVAILPVADRELLRHTRLVTPSSRVLKNINELVPGLSVTLAPGPRPDDMILGLIASLKQDNTE
ncbi:MAG: uroporphyrinogen-III synthase [Woeseiaceae bacterium]|nr:uroporphyrinogen-III synthase [Woeseiaceae bacterium]